MVEAFVFIATKGDPVRVATQVTKFEPVINLHVLEPSDYDMVAFVRCSDLVALREFCTSALGTVMGVRRSTTLICAYEEPVGV